MRQVGIVNGGIYNIYFGSMISIHTKKLDSIASEVKKGRSTHYNLHIPGDRLQILICRFPVWR
jgi:hypothetical protein